MGLRSELPDRWYEVRIIVERSPGQRGRSHRTIWNKAVTTFRSIFRCLRSQTQIQTSQTSGEPAKESYSIIYYRSPQQSGLPVSIDSIKGIHRHSQTIKSGFLARNLLGWPVDPQPFLSVQRLCVLFKKQCSCCIEARIVVALIAGHAVRNVAVPCLVILTFSFTIYAIPMSELGSRTGSLRMCS